MEVCDLIVLVEASKKNFQKKKTKKNSAATAAILISQTDAIITLSAEQIVQNSFGEIV